MPLAAAEAWLEAPPNEKPELLAAADELEAKPKEGVAWLLADSPAREGLVLPRISLENGCPHAFKHRFQIIP